MGEYAQYHHLGEHYNDPWVHLDEVDLHWSPGYELIRGEDEALYLDQGLTPPREILHAGYVPVTPDPPPLPVEKPRPYPTKKAVLENGLSAEKPKRKRAKKPRKPFVPTLVEVFPEQVSLRILADVIGVPYREVNNWVWDVGQFPRIAGMARDPRVDRPVATYNLHEITDYLVQFHPAVVDRLLKRMS